MVRLYKIINNTIRGKHLKDGVITQPGEAVGSSFAASMESCVLWAQLMRRTVTQSLLLDKGYSLPDAMYYIAEVEVEDSTPVLVCKSAMHTDKMKWEVSTAKEAVELKGVKKVSSNDAWYVYNAYADMVSSGNDMFGFSSYDDYEEEEEEVSLKEVLEDEVKIFESSLEEAVEMVKASYSPLIKVGDYGDIINGRFYTPKDNNVSLTDLLLAYIFQGEEDGKTPFELWRECRSTKKPSFKDTLKWLLKENPEYLFSYGGEIYGVDYKKHYLIVVDSIISAIDDLFHINEETFGMYLYNLQGLTKDFRALVWEWLSGNRGDKGTYISNDVKELFQSVIGIYRGADEYRLTITNSQHIRECWIIVHPTLSKGLIHKSIYEDSVNWYISLMDKYMPIEVYVGPRAGESKEVPYESGRFFNPEELYALLKANNDSE